MILTYRVKLQTPRLKHWVNMILLLLAIWLGAGAWICFELRSLFKPSLPGAFRFVDAAIGSLTIFALLFVLNILVFAACRKTVRRVCVPLLGVIDIAALWGCLALLERVWAGLFLGAVGFTTWMILRHGVVWAYGSARSSGTQAGPSPGSAPPDDAGKPVPVKPPPTHHLVAAKDLPPSDKAHSFPKD